MRLNDRPSPQGVIFDMDGVLLVTNQKDSQSWQEVSRQFAPMLDIPTETLVQSLQESRRAYQREIGCDPAKQRRDRLEPFETRQETVGSALKALKRQDKNVAVEMVRAYETLRDVHRHLAPHALEVLHELQRRPLPLALISNGNATYQRRKIAQHRIAPFFDVILIEEEFGTAKPDPRLFLHALERFRLKAHDTWMIGDDLERDIAGSQQVGIFAIWCDFTRQGLPEKNVTHPDWIIHDLSEVLEALILGGAKG